MAYQKQRWENEPSEETPISAEALLHMETQYDESIATMATVFQAHINNPTPHAAYDVDLPDLTLLFENGIT